MRRQLVTLVALAVTALALIFPAGMASAQTAYSTQFTTSITFQNVGNADATVVFTFQAQSSGNPITVNASVAKNAGSSLFIGNVSQLTSANFSKGSATLSSTEPVVATLVQVPPSSSAVKNRPLTNGFNSDAGSTKYLLATVLKNQFNSTTQFSVQNVDSAPVNVTVRYFRKGQLAAAVTDSSTTGLPVGASKYFDAGTVAALGASFDGSVTIEATGKVVATALELSTNSTGASGYDGVATGAQTVYMPSALCNAFGGQNSAYAVQNTSNSATANVTVTYSNGKTSAASITPGGKQSFITCSAAGMPAGFSGSATITATGAPIVAIGKVTGTGLTTAFNGAATGASKLALPYIRWSNTRFDTNQRDRQRSFIAIQNVGTALAANTVSVKYYSNTGALVGTKTLGALAKGQKANSDPRDLGAAGAEFGYYGSATGGSVIVEGPLGSQLVAVVRVQSSPASGLVGEDYNGIPVQ